MERLGERCRRLGGYLAVFFLRDGRGVASSGVGYVSDARRGRASASLVGTRWASTGWGADGRYCRTAFVSLPCPAISAIQKRQVQRPNAANR